MKTLRVLIVNRPDTYLKLGGDVVQMENTAAHLEKLGVEPTICVSSPSEIDLQKYDIVHLFNLSKYAYQWVIHASGMGKPIIMSPIFWINENYPIIPFLTSGLDKWKMREFSHLIGRKWFRSYSKKILLRRKILKLVHWIVPNSQNEFYKIETTFKLNFSNRSTIVPLAVDNRIFGAKNTSNSKSYSCDEKKTILQVAKVSPTKNQLSVLKALKNTDIPLVFIGETENMAYTRECISLGKKRGNTRFIGQVSQKELFRYYDAAKIHILCSWRETCGLSNLEAATFGCNIVSTSESPREYFGNDAWYCEPWNIKQIRRSILEAYYAPLKKGLAQKISSQFTWENTARKTLNAYNHLLKAVSDAKNREIV